MTYHIKSKIHLLWTTPNNDINASILCNTNFPLQLQFDIKCIRFHKVFDTESKQNIDDLSAKFTSIKT